MGIEIEIVKLLKIICRNHCNLAFNMTSLMHRIISRLTDISLSIVEALFPRGSVVLVPVRLPALAGNLHVSDSVVVDISACSSASNEEEIGLLSRGSSPGGGSSTSGYGSMQDDENLELLGGSESLVINVDGDSLEICMDIESDMEIAV